MSRRRYINTSMATDKRLNQLGTEYGDFAVMLYTWMIPHANDDASLNGDLDEFMATVIPMRRDKTAMEVEDALNGMVTLGLLASWDGEVIRFPASSFYRHQSYIKGARRGPCNDSPPDAETDDDSPDEADITENVAQSADDQRKTAQNRASFKSSFKSSFNPLSGDGAKAPVPLFSDEPKATKPRRQPVTDAFLAEMQDANPDLDIRGLYERVQNLKRWDGYKDKRRGFKAEIGYEREKMTRFAASPRRGEPPPKSSVRFDPRTDPTYGGDWDRPRQEVLG